MKYARVALGAGGLLVAGAATLFAWPLWADSMAEREAREWLERRFSTVEIGSFELERHTATFRDVALQDIGLDARLDTITVQFDLGWDRRVEVSRVEVSGGSLTTTLDALEHHKGSTSPSSSGTTDSRVSTENARLFVEGIRVEVDDEEGKQLIATVAATKTGEEVVVDLTAGSVSANERVVGFASAKTSLRADHMFPLQLTVSGASTEVTPEVTVASVAGTVLVTDTVASEIEFDLAGLGNDGDAAWTLRGTVDRANSRGNVTIFTEGFLIGQLPDLYAALPLVDSEDAKIYGDFAVAWEADVFDATGTVGAVQLTVEHPMLATTPVHDVSFEADAKVRFIASQRRLEVERAQLKRGALRIDVSGVLSDSAEDTRCELSVSVTETPCQDVLNALPADLVPGLQGFKLDGEFAMNLDVVVVPSSPESTVLRGDVGIGGCRVRELPQQVEQLDGPFSYEVRRKDGVTQSLLLAEGSPAFAPLEEIAPTMVAAVLTTEDGGFWKHDGFLRSQFEASLRRNVELGRIKRGASTLSMQMVKNVLLSHERTLSRKVQEMFLTWVVEGRLSKKRIMEIYLNVVEFGPGIYGIAAAAQHYFGKQPAELNGKEAAFLATMLPSPVRRHEQWCRGALTDKYAAKVDRVFKFMHDRRRIDDATWELDRDLPLVFDLQEWPGEKACRAEDAALLKATGVQWAESGLLAGRSKDVNEELLDDDSIEELLEDLPGEL